MKEMDRQEAERLVNTYSDLILRLSYTYLKSTQDAEDICQTVFLRLLTGSEVFQSREHEKAWIVRTAINACKDELRSFRRRAVPLEEAAQAPAPEPPRSEVLDAVMALPPKYRAVVHLYYWEGYDQGEIGDILHISRTTVQTRMSRARDMLKKELSDDVRLSANDGAGHAQ